MYIKTAIMLLWLASSYVLLIFVANAWWQAVPLALSLGLADGGRGVQHSA